ncbi:hypothetical protein E5D57_004518 [Metarhizium anisopliae]|nr:hypothetical protein E5D57_004518 [Metarhizium anisopliae]
MEGEDPTDEDQTAFVVVYNFCISSWLDLQIPKHSQMPLDLRHGKKKNTNLSSYPIWGQGGKMVTR